MNPEDDGITHINVYSKGKTELGRLLSNFAETPFVHPIHGKFLSVEGYWYWLSCEKDHRREQLRMAAGWQAKKLGRAFRGTDYPKDMFFEEHVKMALKAKLEQNERIRILLQDSILPFEHYYIYNDNVKEVSEGKWILDFWESARNKLKENA
jgi:hypothetical protein